ncbi:hypothetical protein GCM10012286_40760 [Streptomyces lasiicapitis]|uniref:Orc1-like AAA ATPase domain-containing protein n=1 Tax=Streptomyces lasiicapitis TaxID=1923961 RepID=A0ABQ2M6G6_9ACTN|nr:hypothetical protein GCM10012286_40760 [Streptomyces lasiicapitis]
MGRRGELAAFRANFDVPPADERHRFLFHIHGNAGVGKTSLVREMEQVAREHGALTAYVDESVGSVPEAMAAVVTEFAREGRRFKELDRLLAAHRERRHEAESAALAATLGPEPEAGAGPPPPSAGSMAAARAGLAGLGLVPGVGALAGAIDPAPIAHGTDRLRAGLGARFRNHDDVQLVISPERVLTPVLLRELAEAAAAVPWIVLFFDTYERTGPFLDGWLRDVMTTDRHGRLPANIVVVTAGWQPFDTARWDGYEDFMTDVPLGVFTEAEARGLLSGKGVVAEPVVEEVLRLSSGLPVLVSTLAENRPGEVDDVGDPCATAVERFLKWEQDPVRRAVALVCALPRRLDADVFRAAVAGVCGDEEVAVLYVWLRGLPFVGDREDRVQYHDVVRGPMLRLQRYRSPQGWAEAHARLAETFGRRRAEAEGGRAELEVWADQAWRELRLTESYHLLCAQPGAALPVVLRDAIEACNEGEALARRWADVLVDAGRDADARDVGAWGRRLADALEDGGIVAALGELLDRAGFDVPGRALALSIRGRYLRDSDEHALALADYDAALALDSHLVRALAGRGCTRYLIDEDDAALVDLNRADELAPDDEFVLRIRGSLHRFRGAYDEAVRDLTCAAELNPTRAARWTDLGAARLGLDQHAQALAALDRALRLDADNLWALVNRAVVHVDRGDHASADADLGRAVEMAAGAALLFWHRGNVLHTAGREENSLAHYDRAIALADDYTMAYAARGAALHDLGRLEESLVDLDRAIALDPDHVFALTHRCSVLYLLGRYEAARADADRALELNPAYEWPRCLRGAAFRELGCYNEAFADLSRAIEAAPEGAWANQLRASVCLATGRLGPALADLARYAEIGDDAAWARRRTAEVHLWLGDPVRALAELAAEPVEDYSEELCKAYRMARQWGLARRVALAVGEKGEHWGAFDLALVVSGSEGMAAARPLWQRTVRLMQAFDPDLPWRDDVSIVIAAGTADFPALDARLADALAAGEPTMEWDEWADLADCLGELLHARGADCARLAPRLAAVIAARDAVQAKYALPE